MESSDTRPIFQQTWTIPKYPEVLQRLRKVANGVEKCEPYPGMRWINAQEDVLHRARPEDLVKAVGEILTIDRKEVGEYAQQLVCSYLSSQLLPIEDGEGNPGFSYSAVGIAVFEPGPASYPSIRLTPQAAEGIRAAFGQYFEGQGEVMCILSPVTLPVGFLKQCGPGIARHILYTADILQSSEAGLVEDMAPRVFARAINGVLPQFPPTTDVAELEKAGSAREPCLPEHTHVLPFLISMTRMGDPAPIKWAQPAVPRQQGRGRGQGQTAPAGRDVHLRRQPGDLRPAGNGTRRVLPLRRPAVQRSEEVAGSLPRSERRMATKRPENFPGAAKELPSRL